MTKEEELKVLQTERHADAEYIGHLQKQNDRLVDGIVRMHEITITEGDPSLMGYRIRLIAAGLLVGEEGF